MADMIRGKVARVLNSREVAINIGRNHGVVLGMFFDIMDRVYEDIKDPDTNELLGSIGRPKVRVKITRVEEKLSLASTYRKWEVNVGGSGLGAMTGLSQLLMPPKWTTKHETLKTGEKTWEALDEEKSFVKTGDPVVQVVPVVEEEG